MTTPTLPAAVKAAIRKAIAHVCDPNIYHEPCFVEDRQEYEAALCTALAPLWPSTPTPDAARLAAADKYLREHFDEDVRLFLNTMRSTAPSWAAAEKLTNALLLNFARAVAGQEDTSALRLAAQVAVVQCYHHHKDDVLGRFTIEQLTEIVEATNPARIGNVQVEDIYYAALFPSRQTPPSP